MNKKIENLLNEQINKEFHSAYIYLSMVAYLESKSLSGFAHYMKVQAEEEMSHANKIFNFILERGGKVELAPIAEVKTDWTSLIEIFEDALAHEQYITGTINNLLAAAHEEKDYTAANMLQWFIEEQVEEEANASALVDQLKMINGEGPGIFMLDRELKQRTFVDETTK